jgi:hypothetical protein
MYIVLLQEIYKASKIYLVYSKFKISAVYHDVSSTQRHILENYLIINYEPGNANEKFEGMKNGKGTLYYKNGQKLNGNFTYGKIQGSGKLVSANGVILRSGTFKSTSGLYFDKEEVKVLSGRISDDNFTATGKLYFPSNKIYNGIFKFNWEGLVLKRKGQLTDDNGERIEEGVCSLKQFTNVTEGIESQYGIYFGLETTGKVSGKIHLTNGKTYQGEFEIKEFDLDQIKFLKQMDYFNPTKGTLYSYDGTILQEGKWKNGKFVS